MHFDEHLPPHFHALYGGEEQWKNLLANNSWEARCAYTDHQFDNDKVRFEGKGFPMKPSELFRRQCYLTVWYATGPHKPPAA